MAVLWHGIGRRQVSALQQRCSSLEAERDQLSDQLAHLSAQSRKARCQPSLMRLVYVIVCAFDFASVSAPVLMHRTLHGSLGAVLDP